MKRSLLIVGLVSALTAIPASALAITTSASPTPSLTPSASPSPSSAPGVPVPTPRDHKRSPEPQSSAAAARKAARDLAFSSFQSTMMQAQNGRDLAFADANANLMQSLQAAGKDKVAQKAARETYRAAAKGIVTIYKQAVATARATLQAALAAIK